MANKYDIHPALIIFCFAMLGITISTAVAMKKFPFSTSLETTELKAQDLVYRGSSSGSLRPGIEVK